MGQRILIKAPHLRPAAPEVVQHRNSSEMFYSIALLLD